MRSIFCFLLVGLCVIALTRYLCAGYALQFDGDNDIIWLDHRAMNGLGDCTVEFWIYVNQTGTAASPFSCANERTSNEYYFYFSFNQNRNLDPYVKDENAGQGPRFPIGEWFHFAMTRDGDSGQWIIYINGEEEGRGNLPAGDLSVDEGGITMGQDQDELGGGFDRDQALHGLLDEFRIWNFLRSIDDISSTMNYMISVDSDGLVAYYHFDEGEGQILHDVTDNGYDGVLGEREGEDAADPEWVVSEAPIYGGEIAYSIDSIEFGPVTIGRSPEFEFLLSNVSEEDDEWHTLEFSLTDHGGEPDWLNFEPDEGTINAGDTITVNFTAETEDLDPGEYERIVLLECNAMNLSSMEIPIHIFAVEGFGQLFGRVTDAATGDAIANAPVVIDGFGLSDTTDREGEYSFLDISAWTYNISVIMPDYLPAWAREIEVPPDEEVRVDFELLHSEFIHDPERIEVSLLLDTSIVVPMTISNPGNGPLTWTVEFLLPEGVETDPWERREYLFAALEVDDGRLEGVVFVEDHYYVSGANGDDLSTIYILDREGALIDTFRQPGNSNYGMSDLAWDGELIWGSGARMVYGFTTEGELVRQFNGPYQTNKALAWDSERELLWICDLTSNIVGVDREGNRHEELDRCGFRIYGLAYWPNDPDGYDLYIFHDINHLQVVHKMNPENGDTMFVGILEPEEGGSPRGAFITNRLDAFSWVFITMVNNNHDAGWDRIDVWQLHSNTGWIMIEPDSGVVETEGEADLSLTLSSIGMAPEVYEADLIYLHDGVGGIDSVHVAFEVSEVPPYVDDTVGEVSSGFGLLEAYPNPFNGQVWIEFNLEFSCDASIEAFDLTGRKVADVTVGWFGSGVHSTAWNAEGLPSGVYLLRLNADERKQTLKLLLMR